MICLLFNQDFYLNLLQEKIKKKTSFSSVKSWTTVHVYNCFDKYHR